MLKVWIKHCVIGIPLSAFLHTCLQFAYGFSPNVNNKIWVLPIHFLLGMIVGGTLILGPAYTIQSFVDVVIAKRATRQFFHVLFGAFFQGSIVAVWALTIGIEPSLSGNFLLTPPMIVSGMVSGGITSYFATPRVRNSQ